MPFLELLFCGSPLFYSVNSLLPWRYMFVILIMNISLCICQESSTHRRHNQTGLVTLETVRQRPFIRKVYHDLLFFQVRVPGDEPFLICVPMPRSMRETPRCFLFGPERYPDAKESLAIYLN